MSPKLVGGVFFRPIADTAPTSREIYIEEVIAIKRLITTFTAVLFAALALSPTPVETPTMYGPPVPKVAKKSKKTPAPKLASRGGDTPTQYAPPAHEPRLLFDGYASISAYTGIDQGQRGDDITASGQRAVPYYTVAAWAGIPFGSRVEVTYEDGHTREYVCEDRGSAITYGRIDLYVSHDDQREAIDYGRKNLRIKIYAP